jgi:multimeric flavodoxin WrbA
MAEILEKMQAADVLVIATPTYFLTMNGKLKTAIDRFLPKWQQLGGHDVYLIITGHDERSGLKLVGDELTSIFESLGNHVRDIIWGEGVWQKGEVLSTKAMDEAYQAGRSL